ncbi:MAG: glycosyltransferase family 4 protein, partial [Anaerolineales bacterium]|nr:glycosyltransferase family 4 protein [Anaerolineales bacterium]
MLNSTICLTPRVSGVGGMVSFSHKLAAGLEARGVHVTYDLDAAYDAVLVIGGTRQLAGLWRAKRRGVPIVQRLDGMNWLHRQKTKSFLPKLPTGARHYLRSTYGNLLLAFIRRMATHIVYQSNFVVAWWEREHGATRVPYSVIYNGVDLEAYSPQGTHQRPSDLYRLLLVEGSLDGGYEMGLESAVGMAGLLADEYHLPIELMVVGKVSEELKASWDARSRVPINWAGLVPRADIPAIDRSAHLLYSSDLNAACPNSVIEALACGLPVVAYDTGALPELVTPQAGRVVAYGGDPWQLDPPDVPALATGAAEVLTDQE